jgi:hypothetical protein
MNRGTLIFSPAARARLLAIAACRGAILRPCTTSSALQICHRSFGSRAIGASNPTTMIARSMPPSSRRAIVASAWRGEGTALSGDLDDQPLVGRIEIITGPMFSGKSTELLRRAAEHEVKKKRRVFFLLNFDSFSSRKRKKERQKKTQPRPRSSSFSYTPSNRPPVAASRWSRARKTPDTAFLPL